MRPAILNRLFAPTTSLAGIGPKTERLFTRLAGPRVVDLLWLLPTGVIDRSVRTSVADAPIGGIVTLTLEVLDHEPPRTERLPYRVRCQDESGPIDLVFFHAEPTRLLRSLPVGETRLVSGRIDWFRGRAQMSHPDYILPPAEAGRLPLFEPVYPLTAGLSPRLVQRAIKAALDVLPALPEWQDEAWLKTQAWPAFGAALRTLHAPQRPSDLAPTLPARQRLAYDELLANQLALALVRLHHRRQAAQPLVGDGRYVDAIRRALPFGLTRAQERSRQEILADMARPERMLRLLQGDVGSGKTVVALIAMATAAEAGTQAALMAPTEILARQHFATIAPLAEAAGLEAVLLTGRDKGRARDETLARIATGAVPLAIGTHALFQEAVQFRSLGLAVIDEQHRFGVHERLSLSEKGGGRAHILVMTATPIPRTLAMTYYGDMESSRLDEKPPGRKPVATRTIPLDRLDEVIAAVGRALAQGERVYWVCPLVEDSEHVDAAAAEARHHALQVLFGETVGLVHGRLAARDKDRAMADFKAGRLTLLVATTVIEVGVDVPEATIMVIEHAERFGLAQLHQLRGRVGRGGRPGTCLLLYQRPLGPTARARLRILRETDDGFRIAEEDLHLRGAGDVLGLRQSGLPAFRLASLPQDEALLAAAHDDAALMAARDPALASSRGEALRLLLYLFQRDAAIRYRRSG